MVKRELSKEEKERCERQLERLDGDKEYEEFAEEYARLMLDKGLEQNYKKQRRDFQDKLKLAKDNLKQITATQEFVRDQLENGVEEIKEDKENKED